MGKTKVKFDFKPSDFLEGVRFSSSRKQEVMERIANYVKDEVLLDVGSGRSPVTGRKFKKYKNPKKYPGNEKAKSPVNLELTGAMLDSFDVRIIGNHIRAGVSDEENDKADNHNKFTSKSLDTKVPARKFIPNIENGENFRPKIRKGITDIIREAKEEDEIRKRERNGL